MERIALVTGGSSGIGRAAVQALAEAGWYVYFTCRDIVRGETAAEAVRAVGGSCEAFRADLADTAASRALVAQLTERFGRLDVLVNCAGISNTKSIEEIDEAEWDTMLNVNLRGTFFLTQAAFLVISGSGAAESSRSPRSPGSAAHSIPACITARRRAGWRPCSDALPCRARPMA